ncbi:N-acetylmuramic acid 6-phosphate etherase [Antarcticibacterium flavum]|uniref:N-acetylmuramic acid 6-phosphate etherase n=1 Tax=Antarcticibacterium flavum TaxID=2058175 RepID=A0A5B7X2X5_9FLAO|nr:MULTISPECIES: N-acetylmuramic acid 6-phosphate etherase [Antarcticibacterium]MCM4160083.1 N-acetylmuramic acid 6-phosphate etherase [Antarcticibacterium sp. W02-3]QCY69640.1 N-acetylmuramic acid 6-phosphate etherase [Antarcticibacterium flavum]
MEDQNKPSTERSSRYNDLEHMSTEELLRNMNREDKTVPEIIEKEIPAIEALVDVIVRQIELGGRLFYIGAGTSGRLGVLDASECPPTFGVSDDVVIGLIAGGDVALRKAVENAEDNTTRAWKDLQQFGINKKDVLIGIAASGTTPYVIGGVEDAAKNGLITGCITNNKNSPLARAVKYPIEIEVGPEFVTGSTRMKSGTAQKLVLNMISTSVMIKLGRVKGNKMVDMQLSNQKLVGRGTRMIMEELGIDQKFAEKLLLEYKSVRAVLQNFK